MCYSVVVVLSVEEQVGLLFECVAFFYHVEVLVIEVVPVTICALRIGYVMTAL